MPGFFGVKGEKTDRNKCRTYIPYLHFIWTLKNAPFFWAKKWREMHANNLVWWAYTYQTDKAPCFGAN